MPPGLGRGARAPGGAGREVARWGKGPAVWQERSAGAGGWGGETTGRKEKDTMRLGPQAMAG